MCEGAAEGGAWGVGKSSMIKLIQGSLSKRPTLDLGREFVFVEFNAWLYQGYDDARAALMDVIANKLVEEAKKRSTALEKTTALAKKVTGAQHRSIDKAAHIANIQNPARFNVVVGDFLKRQI